MPPKVDVSSSLKLPAKTLDKLNAVLSSLPPDHTLGIDRVKLVDTIDEPRLTPAQRASLPGLYHPRQGTQRARLDINVRLLLNPEQKFTKRLLSRAAFYNNLSAVAVSLVGQHYFLTYKHSMKKGAIEQAVRNYTTTHLKRINASENRLRTRLFAPLQPTLERWARALNRRASASRSATE